MNYQKIYNQIIERAQKRKLEGYSESHHIIPKCMGGSNDLENMVELTAREHFICHRLLCEIHPENTKLGYALWLMVIGKNRQNSLDPYSISGRAYERLRIAFINQIKGKKMPQSTIDKISENRKGILHSDETKTKISNSLMGRDVTWGDKISKGKKGVPRDITWGEQISKSNMGKPKKGKCVVQICPQTLNVIQEFQSLSEAKRVTGAKGIWSAIVGRYKTSGGYIWKYKE
jgi:hypothetical protein